ncbi:MAG: AAA family ATPase [Patescibacteria group bacterium]|jgi:predicted kinase
MHRISKYKITSKNIDSTAGRVLSDKDFLKVMSEYEKTLVVPDKGKKGVILCPVGQVGAGKTTVVKPLAKKLGLLRISMDEIRRILLRDGFNLVRTKEMFLQLMLKYLDRGYDFVVDADCSRDVSLIKKIAKDYGKKVIWIHVKPPEKYILNKLKNYKHSWLFKDSAEAIACYRALKNIRRGVEKRIKFFYTFDPSKPDLNKQVERFLVKLNKESTVGR